MRILVVGAGAVGGYFGGRLLQAGRDVTFLLRPARAAQIRTGGLSLVSPHGDITLHPAVVTAETLGAGYDLVLLTVKAYALEAALADIAPAMAGGAMVLPLLNGMRHIDALAARFGAAAVLGGVCRVATTLDPAGRVMQLSPMQELEYGARDGANGPRLLALDAAFQGAGFSAKLSERITAAMWEKWIMLASLGALNCLGRGTVGEITAAPGGPALAAALLAETSAVAAAEGYAPDAAYTARTQAMLTATGSNFASSMYRDLVQGLPIEADQIIGDLLARAALLGVAVPLLCAVYTQLSVYQARPKG